MNSKSNGIYIGPEQHRANLAKALSQVETRKLIQSVKDHDAWMRDGDFTLDTNQIINELFYKWVEPINSNKIYGRLQVYDAVARELASRFAIEFS